MITSTAGTVMAELANRQLYHYSTARSNATAMQHVTPRPLRVKDSSVGRLRSCTSPPGLQGGGGGGGQTPTAPPTNSNVFATTPFSIPCYLAHSDQHSDQFRGQKIRGTSTAARFRARASPASTARQAKPAALNG